MTKEKDTSADQIFALAIRIAKVLRSEIEVFDGDLVQAAIVQRGDPFWDDLKKISHLRFTIPFEFREIGEPQEITINDGRPPEALLVAKDWKKCVTREAMNIIASCSPKIVNAPEKVDLVFLYPTRYTEPKLILEEFKRRGWENAALDDALRLVEKYPGTYFVNCGKYNHNIAFINERDPSNNLELGYDGMGEPFLDKSTRNSLCYAARRKKR